MTMAQQATVINSVFQAHGVGCRVALPPATFQAAGYNAFALQRKVGLSVKKVTALAAELDEALQTPVRFSFMPLSLEVERPDPQRLPLLSLWAQLCKANGDGVRMVVGQRAVDNSLRPSRLNLAESTMPHALIAGTTGSGKTELLREMLLSAAAMQSPAKLALVVLDPKAVDFRGLYGLPHLAHSVVTDPAECVQALVAVIEELERRKAAGIQEPEKRIVVAIDELADLMAIAGSAVEAHIQRIISVGRGLGVHIIAATQQPLSDVVGSVVKANFPVRLVGKVVDDNAAKTAAGIYRTGAERLPGRGSFLCVNGHISRIQAYHCTADEQTQMIAAIARRWDNGRSHYALRLDAPKTIPTSADPPPAPAPYKPPMVGSVKLTRRIFTTFAEYYNKETGELSYGGTAAMIRACFGDNAHTGGSYRLQAQKVVDYLKATTTTGRSALQ